MRTIFSRIITLILSTLFSAAPLCAFATEPSQGKSDFSITLSVTKKTCYVREEVELELEIKSKLTSIDIGFSRYDLNLPGAFLEEVLPVERAQGRAVIRRRRGSPERPRLFRTSSRCVFCRYQRTRMQKDWPVP